MFLCWMEMGEEQHGSVLGEMMDNGDDVPLLDGNGRRTTWVGVGCFGLVVAESGVVGRVVATLVVGGGPEGGDTNDIR
ncbi:hypothetical protein Dimus_005479 [Dionaea muscipula]